MLCKSPFRKGYIEHGCGRCLACKVQKKKIWKTRMLLESKDHDKNSFITLTYSDEKLPKGGTLDPKDTQLFLHRLRKNLQRNNLQKVRYFLVGEYGTETQRPHYHAAIFGHACDSGTRYVKGRKCECRFCEIIRKSWSINNEIIGHTAVGTLEKDSIDYICGYLHKTATVDGQKIMGLTNKNDPKIFKWLKGRHPEFTRMSRNPGIGGNHTESFTDFLTSDQGADFVLNHGDVPSYIITNGKQTPIGRYMMDRIRKQYGFKEKKKTPFSDYVSYTPESTMQNMLRKNIEKKEAIHYKGEKIGKNKYEFELDYKKQKIKSFENRIQTNNKPEDNFK